jgi:hypothetical protein
MDIQGLKRDNLIVLMDLDFVQTLQNRSRRDIVGIRHINMHLESSAINAGAVHEPLLHHAVEPHSMIRGK